MGVGLSCLTPHPCPVDYLCNKRGSGSWSTSPLSQYCPGTSPDSSWVPLHPLSEEDKKYTDPRLRSPRPWHWWTPDIRLSGPRAASHPTPTAGDGKDGKGRRSPPPLLPMTTSLSLSLSSPSLSVPTDLPEWISPHQARHLPQFWVEKASCG